MSILGPVMCAALATLVVVQTAPAAAAPVPADPARLAQLATVQQAVAKLPTRSDRDRFGRIEYWERADATGGDCEDKALAARDALIALGWPPQALRLALGWDEIGIWHAVLTVDVASGGTAATWVLDNRFTEPQTWDTLVRRGYRWSIRQTGGRGWQHVGK